MPEQRNERFAAALDETGFSALGLARRVRDLAKAEGVKPTATDHTAVARWLAGQRPRPVTARLVADVISQKLGRAVTEADLGFVAPTIDPTAALTYHHDLEAAVAASTELFRSDVQRRRFLADSVITSSVFAVPAVRYLTAPPASPKARASGKQIGMREVGAVRSITDTFRKLDNQFGGGYGRSSITAYLNDEAGPMLQRSSYTAPVGSALHSAVAELMLLAGWMAYDLEQHPVAASYLIQALSLTKAGGDHLLGAEILAAMSHQAAYLRKPDDAVDMARAAQVSALRSGQPRLLAEAFAAEAHGHALSGDSRAAILSLGEAERALAAPDRDDVPAWLTYFDSAYLAAKAALTLRAADDPGGAIENARRSLDMQAGYARGRAFNLFLLAGSLSEAGHVDEAAATGILALNEASVLSSTRIVHRASELARHLKPHRGTAQVDAFRRRARDLVSERPPVRELPSGR